MNIVIVDDDKYFLNDMNEILTELGFSSLSSYSSPTEMLRHKTDHSESLFLLDLDLKNEINGFMLLTEIRRMLKNAKVFVISGSISKNDMYFLNVLGVNRIFSKPVNPQTLANAIKGSDNGYTNS